MSTIDENGNEIIKIIDFGCSREMNDSLMANTYLGTPLYMSPEVIDYGNYDYKADIYSIGIILFELLSLGFHPYVENLGQINMPRLK